MIKFQINNVVHIDFKNAGLNKGQLNLISKRIDEIDEALDLCGDNDNDVHDNLMNELDALDAVLVASIKICEKSAKIRENPKKRKQKK